MKLISHKIHSLPLFLLVVVINSACASATLTPIFTPIATSTAIPTSTITPSPTLTRTPTSTLTPSPTPVGGALIAFNQYNSTIRKSYCGLVSAEGRLITKSDFHRFEADQDARYCPKFAVTGYTADPIGSRNHEKYVYQVGIDPVKALIYYIGDISTSRSRFLIDLTPYVNKDTFYASTPSLIWLADNRHLVFFDRNSYNLILLDSQDGALKVIGNFPWIQPPSWGREVKASPTDPLILFQSGEPRSDVHLLNTETGEDINSTTDVDFEWISNFVWSPDGSRFSFAIQSKVPGSPTIAQELRIVDRNGNLIARIDTAWEAAGWSPAVDYFLFQCNTVRNTTELCLSDANGEEIVKVGQRLKNAIEFAWSPDGEKIAYYTGLGTRLLTAHILWLKTGEENEIVSFPEDIVIYPIQWSPDSQWLLFQGAGPDVPKELGLAIGLDTALLCNLQSICNNLNGTKTFVTSAEWWNIPPN